MIKTTETSIKDGFILVNKEAGVSSFDLIRDLRKKIGKAKYGHTGTLDMQTSGLVVIAVGIATKFIPILSENKTKEYIARAKLGIKTETGDVFGKTIKKEVPNKKLQTELEYQELDQLLKTFLGTSEQLPPIYSNKKVAGKRLYEYALADEHVEIKSQTIEITEIELLEINNEEEFTFRVVVSKGTYIRSLIEDIAEKMGTIGTMSNLIRSKTDGFTLEEAKSIHSITTSDIHSLGKYLKKHYQTIEVYDKIKILVNNGAILTAQADVKYPVLYQDQVSRKLLAIYDKVADNKIKPIIFLKELDEN